MIKFTQYLFLILSISTSLFSIDDKWKGEVISFDDEPNVIQDTPASKVQQKDPDDIGKIELRDGIPELFDSEKDKILTHMLLGLDQPKTKAEKITKKPVTKKPDNNEMRINDKEDIVILDSNKKKTKPFTEPLAVLDEDILVIKKTDLNTTTPIVIKEEISKVKKKRNIFENPITLKKYVIQCMEKSHALKELNEKANVADERINEAKAGYYPFGTVTANFGAKRETTHYLAEYDSNKTEDPDTQDTYATSNLLVKVKQMLYDGGKVKHDVKRRQFESKVVDYNNRGLAEKEVLKFVKAYNDVVFSKMAYDVNVNNMNKLKALQSIVKTKKDAGAANNADESAINSNIANAQSSLISVQSRYIDSYDYFKFLLEAKSTTSTPYEHNFDMELNDIEKIANKTKIANYSVLAVKSRIEAAKAKRFGTIAQAGAQLSLNLSGNRDYTKFTLNDESDKDKLTGTASLKLDYVFSDGGLATARAQRFKGEYLSLYHSMNKTIQDEVWKVKKIYSSVQSLTSSIDSVSVEIEEIAKTLDIFWEKFKLGEQDIQILLQEQRQYNKAQLNKIKSQSIKTYGFFQLLASTGELIPYITTYITKSVDFYDEPEKTVYKNEIARVTDKDDINSTTPKDSPIPTVVNDEFSVEDLEGELQEDLATLPSNIKPKKKKKIDKELPPPSINYEFNAQDLEDDLRKELPPVSTKKKRSVEFTAKEISSWD